jgi:hypothetical protein
MNMLEDRLRAATRAAADTVTPLSLPPLELPGSPDPAPPRRRWRARPGSRAWPALLAPLAAAAAVVAVIAGSLAISATFHGRSRGSRPGPAARLHGSPLGDPAALRDVPPYFVSLSPMWTAHSAVVRSTVTGRTLATVRPPAPYRIFTWVSGAADDRTFVLAAQRYWHIGHGQAGMPAENRDNATPMVFFKLTFDPASNTAALARLAIPETIQASHLFGMTLSPDGTKLALSLYQTVQVVTLATGATRSWVLHGSGAVANWKPFGQVFSWTADGKMLEFQQWGGKLQETTHIRLLGTTAPGTSVNAARIVLTFPNSGGTANFSLLNTLLTPDGSRIVTATTSTHGLTGQITEFSARTGKPVLSEDRFSASVGGQNVLWAGPHGKALVVSDPRGQRSRYGGRANILGVLEGNRFTPIPHGADTTGSIAW